MAWCLCYSAGQARSGPDGPDTSPVCWTLHHHRVCHTCSTVHSSKQGRAPDCKSPHLVAASHSDTFLALSSGPDCQNIQLVWLFVPHHKLQNRGSSHHVSKYICCFHFQSVYILCASMAWGKSLLLHMSPQGRASQQIDNVQHLFCLLYAY